MKIDGRHTRSVWVDADGWSVRVLEERAQVEWVQEERALDSPSLAFAVAAAAWVSVAAAWFGRLRRGPRAIARGRDAR